MDNYKVLDYHCIVPALAAALSWLYGGWDIFLGVTLSMVAFDLATGLLAALLEGRIRTAATWRMTAKKLFVLIAIAVAVQLDKLIGSSSAIRTVTCLFYIGNEGISIIDNMGRAGVPLPAKMKRLFERLRSKDE